MMEALQNDFPLITIQRAGYFTEQVNISNQQSNFRMKCPGDFSNATTVTRTLKQDSKVHILMKSKIKYLIYLIITEKLKIQMR